jgi:hypothetical protein
VENSRFVLEALQKNLANSQVVSFRSGGLPSFLARDRRVKGTPKIHHHGGRGSLVDDLFSRVPLTVMKSLEEGYASIGSFALLKAAVPGRRSTGASHWKRAVEAGKLLPRCTEEDTSGATCISSLFRP